MRWESVAFDVLFQRSECMCLKLPTLSVFRIFFFVADAAVALLPDVAGRLAFVSLPNSASVIAGVESAASEAKPATDSAFELTSASSSASPSVGELEHLSPPRSARLAPCSA